jgi:preprotein translocase subunit YajC
VLTILVLIAIGIGIIFWRRQKRLEQEMEELRRNRRRGTPDSGGRDY